MKIHVEPIAFVRSARDDTRDDFWGGAESYVELAERVDEDSLRGLEEFSHVEVLFYFNRVDPEKIVSGSRHPRNDPDLPEVGIFAQRGKNRPNRIGTTICKILRLEKRRIYVAELDAVDGTPVLDLKPVMKEFLPRDEVRQPAWVHEIMRNYWKPESP